MLKAPASLAKQQERLTLFSFSNRLCPFTMDNRSILDSCNVSLLKTYVLLICCLTLLALALIFLLLRSIFDAQQTIALLQQTDQICAKDLERYVLIGELSLNGRLRPCNGILPMVTEAKNRGSRAVILPFENWKEAESVTGIEVYGLHTLRETVQFLEGKFNPCQSEAV